MAVQISVLLAALLAWGSAVASAAPAPADPAASLDALSVASDRIDSGMAAAERLWRAGDALGALAALERLMIVHPEAHGAMLQHASLLCRLDDRDGAKVEFDQLTRSEFPAAVWASATAPCGGSPTDYGWSG
jgi:hypothetical protein